MPSKRSRVHPTYKTKYRVTNWPEYDRSLVGRGDVRFWMSPAAIANWNAKPSDRWGSQGDEDPYRKVSNACVGSSAVRPIGTPRNHYETHTTLLARSCTLCALCS